MSGFDAVDRTVRRASLVGAFGMLAVVVALAVSLFGWVREERAATALTQERTVLLARNDSLADANERLALTLQALQDRRTGLDSTEVPGAMLPPAVYLRYVQPTVRGMVQRVATGLAEQGYPVIGAEPLGEDEVAVYYFSDDRADDAREVASRLAAFRLSAEAARRGGPLPLDHLEVWFGGVPTASGDDPLRARIRDLEATVRTQAEQIETCASDLGACRDADRPTPCPDCDDIRQRLEDRIREHEQTIRVLTARLEACRPNDTSTPTDCSAQDATIQRQERTIQQLQERVGELTRQLRTCAADLTACRGRGGARDG